MSDVINLEPYGWGRKSDNAHKRIYIGFQNSEDVGSFLSLMAGSIKLRKYVLAASTELYAKHPRRIKIRKRWWVDSTVCSEDDAYGNWTGTVDVLMSVRFPKSHLKEVVTIVTAKRNASSSERR